MARHLASRPGRAVGALWAAFVDNWAETGQPLFDESVDRPPVPATPGSTCVQVVRGDAETGWGEMSTLVRSLISLARRRLRISADYFVPDSDALALLADAVRRGVAVEVLRPGPHAASRTSQRASEAQYPRLFDAGVQLWAYQRTVLQAKVVTVDGEVGVVGGLNFNSRSLTLDDELSVVVLDPQVVGVLDRHFEDDRADAEEVDPRHWRNRGRADRAAVAALGFLARRL